VNESTFVPDLLDVSMRRGFRPRTLAADKGYDGKPVYEACEKRGCNPIIRLRRTAEVKRGDHLPPVCPHGTWVFGGTDYRRRRSKWRCPHGKCRPKSVWEKASRIHPLIPRSSPRWKALYAGRNAVEGEFARLKYYFGLRRPPVRGRDRMSLFVDLVILARLASALTDARAGPQAC